MSDTLSISSIRMAAVVTSANVGIGVLTLPRFAAVGAESGAPLLTVAGNVCGAISLLLLAYLCSRHPGENLIYFSEKLVGAPVARVMNGLLILYFLLVSGISLRQFGEVVVLVLLQKSPMQIIECMLLLVVALSARRDLIKFSFVHSFYLPFILLPGLFIVLIATRSIDPDNLLPLIGNHHGDWPNESVKIASLSQMSFVFCLLVPLMKFPKRAASSVAIGAAVGGALYLLVVLTTVGMFGSEETKILTYPTLETARSASMGAGQRLDALFLIIWVISIYTTIYATYYFSVHASRDLFRLGDHRMFASFYMPAVYAVSMIPSNIHVLYSLWDWSGRYGFLLTAAYPLLLLVMSFIRSGRGQAHA
ncbi:endospore germination permease [Paenibacillus sp. D51F]